MSQGIRQSRSHRNRSNLATGERRARVLDTARRRPSSKDPGLVTALRHAVLALAVSLTSVIVAPPTAANEFLNMACPCEVESDGTTARVTAGVRSFRSTDARPLLLAISVRHPSGDYFNWAGTVTLADELAAGETLTSATYEVELDVDESLAGERVMELFLYEQIGDRLVQRDRVRMESPVDVTGEFTVGDLDLATDADGDGVADSNERIQGTDPADADSTPADSTIDVLVMYTPGLRKVYDGDPTTRIQHEFAMANAILANSAVQAQFRVVGMVEVQVDESKEVSQSNPDVRLQQLERHGADLDVLFRPLPFGSSACGFAFVGGWRKQGVFELRWEQNKFATVFSNCGAATLAHELGHLMGLGHSAWQLDVGTWRWSRGHAVDNDFGTVMTYGPRRGEYIRLDVYSSPSSACTGLLEQEKPCGQDRADENGADAVTSLNGVRFQVAAYRGSRADTDSDGFVDPVDDLPNDAAEWLDSDDDGLGNNSDMDDDNDGVADGSDAFPLDASEITDSDEDGVGDNADAFPDDPAEFSDTDADGVGDNTDAFPEDPAEAADSDDDGVGDNADPWPEDSSESTDTDGDGIGDNGDTDDDNDGIVDSLDIFPLDAAKWDLASYQFIGEEPGDQAGDIMSRGADGDEVSFIFGVPLHNGGGVVNTGAAYLIAGSDLETLDAVDGDVDRTINLANVPSGTKSWKFVGGDRRDQAGSGVASSGDMDGDGYTDLIIGARFYDGEDINQGAAYVVSGADFAAADAADGSADHIIELDQVASQPRSWQFLGEAAFNSLGQSIAAVPDLDGDGSAEVLLGAVGYDADTERQTTGAVYLVASSDFAPADRADGMEDGVIELAQAAAQPNSWKLVGESIGDSIGASVSAPGDLQGGGNVYIAINSINRRPEEGATYGGAVYLILSSDLSGADAADELSDHIVDLGQVAGQPNSWKLLNGSNTLWAQYPVHSAARTDGSARWLVIESNVLAMSDLAAADEADGLANGVVNLAHAVIQPGSMRLPVTFLAAVGDTDGDGSEELLGGATLWMRASAHMFSAASLEAVRPEIRSDTGLLHFDTLSEQATVRALHGPRRSVQLQSSTAGDVDGDGLADTLLGDTGPSTEQGAGTYYLVLSADLNALDRVDGIVDELLLLGNLAGDSDGDGFSNSIDSDDDGDGIPDPEDEFHLDPTEWMDTDRDGVGDNADARPGDRHEQYDTDGDGLADTYEDDDDDGDGIADSADPYPVDTDDDAIRNRNDPDDDNDGVPDVDDALPLDATESEDTDGDGIGNNADTDDDGDGVADTGDAFPLDRQESADSDGDGVGDNGDAFPQDAAETGDFDGDGTGDEADEDDDNDGVADVDDPFPLDARASRDTDGDGVPDSLDAFPADPAEWIDTDGSGTGDNADDDDDDDGILDSMDLFPRDAARWGLTSVRFALDAAHDSFVPGVATAGNLDGSEGDEILFRAPDMGDDTVVYIVAYDDLRAADAADGALDGSIEVRYVPPQDGSWKLLGVEDEHTGVPMTALGDLDGDGFGEFLESDSRIVSSGFIVSGADLLGADALDGAADGVVRLGWVPTQPNSYRLRGLFRAGTVRAAFPADFDGNGVANLVIGQPGIGVGNSPGTIHLYSTDSLSALDALNGAGDGLVSLSASDDLWGFAGESPRDSAGTRIAMGAFDQDGQADLVVAAPNYDAVIENEGAVYLLASQDRDSADLADGAVDSQIKLEHVASQPNSWKFVGESEMGNLGREVFAGDVNGDGRPDLVMSSRVPVERPMISVASGDPEELAALDAADGTEDGVITLGSIESGANATLFGNDVPQFGSMDLVDFDGDGREDLVIGFNRDQVDTRVAHLITASSLFGDYTSSDGVDPGLDRRLRAGGSYELYAPEADTNANWIVAGGAGDVDHDGLGDVLVTVVPYVWGGSDASPESGAVYLLVGADLPHLDAADGTSDGRIFLSNVVGERR